MASDKSPSPLEADFVAVFEVASGLITFFFFDADFDEDDFFFFFFLGASVRWIKKCIFDVSTDV